MKKYVAFFMLVVCITLSCSPQPAKQTTRANLPIELFVDKFAKDNPNYKLNDITREETNTLFEKTILDTLKTVNMLENVPLRLEGINKVENKIIAHFQSWIMPNQWKFKGSLNELHVDVFAEVNDSLVNFLENDKYYYIYGHLLERLNGLSPAESLFGRSVMPYTNSISFEKDDIWDDKIEVNLGILHFRIDSVRAFIQ